MGTWNMVSQDSSLWNLHHCDTDIWGVIERKSMVNAYEYGNASMNLLQKWIFTCSLDSEFRCENVHWRPGAEAEHEEGLEGQANAVYNKAKGKYQLLQD